MTRVLILTEDLIAGGINRYALILSEKLMGFDDVQVALATFEWRCTHSTWLLGEAASRGLSVHVFRAEGLFDVRSIMAVAQVLRSEGIHVLHTQGYRSNLIGRLATRLARMPVRLVDTVHGVPASRSWRTRLFHDLDLATWRLSDLHIAVCNDTRHKLVKRRLDPSRIVTIYNGISLPDANSLHHCEHHTGLRRRLQIPDHAPLVGFVGRVTTMKGALVFIQAMLQVAAQDPRPFFLVMGDGPAQPSCERMVTSSGMGDRFVFVDVQRDVDRFYRQLDIAVVSSYAEGLPFQVLEAMGHGVPVVASHVGGIPEIITHEHSGILCPVGSTDAFSDAVLDLLQDPQKREAIGKAGRLVITSRFSAHTMVEKTVKVYRQMASRVAKTSNKED